MAMLRGMALLFIKFGFVVKTFFTDLISFAEHDA